MDEATREMHKRAALFYGRESSCGTKIKYSEDSAVKAAESMSRKYAGTKVLEAYPCPWCERWHVGRQMTEDEQQSFA